MAEERDKLAAALEALRQDYLQQLPGELQELRELAERLAAGEHASSLLDDLHHRLHKLAGSGGTFGLHKLSMQARSLEQQLRAWLQDRMPFPVGDVRNSFSREVAALAELLAATEGAVVSTYEDDVAASQVGRQIHVWLVEEDETLGRELVRVLGQFGFEVSLFTHLERAERATGMTSPDVMIIDMPFSKEGENASEPVQNLAAFRQFNCPLIFISAQGDFESRLRAARLGARGFLLKPIDMPKLVDRLEQIFEAQHAAPFRVLVVDDDTTLAAHYSLVLQSAGVEAEHITEPGRIVERISAFHPELILMDMQMPEYSGPELATVIRQYDEWLALPIIYLSAETDVDVQLQAMGHGADDFLTKPISDAHLVSAVKVRAVRARQLNELMSKDSLTGLLKHSRIKEELAVELTRAHRRNQPLCVVMCDIDHFKRVNDTYGHPTGDRVIRAVAQLLKQRLRKSDAIGRYGGEEFAVLLPECDEAMANSIMNDIRERFSARRFHQQGGGDFTCTLSVGIACSSHYLAADGNELLNAADGALYQAKHGGRNQVVVAQ